VKLESEDEEDETLEQISRQSPPKSNGKKPPMRQQEEESESEYDCGDSDEDEADEEPKAKKRRMNTPPKKVTKSTVTELNGNLKCPSCDQTFKSKLGLKGHIGECFFLWLFIKFTSLIVSTNLDFVQIAEQRTMFAIGQR
jgi:hypothetical protein